MSKWVGPENGIMILDSVPDYKVESSHEINFNRLRMPIIAVYRDPKDYPGYYIARVFDMDMPTNIIMAKKDLAELQQDIAKHTVMVWLPRHKEDDPVLMGTWI